MADASAGAIGISIAGAIGISIANLEPCIAVKNPGEERALLSALADANYAPQYSRWLDPPI
jgi:hypothetical protein